ncbi:MAG: M20/M25/M40 family metallo-hydrolase, partial [Actinomycetia bacterium]|nr:M20/M25/M40 family metallo-hydrolase [Actinomycetes bacterium]
MLDRALALREWAAQRLATLVNLDSPSGDGPLIRAVTDQLADGFARLGGRIARDGDHLVCRWPGPGDGHVLLVGHADTVFPVGTAARRPFHLDGDTLRGPGVHDMKGALVAVELALRLIHGQPLRRPVRLVIVADEEIGSPDGQRVVAAQSVGAVAALGLEPPLPGGALKIGRRGVARVRLAVRGVAAHSGLDADAGVSAIDELVDQLSLLRGAFPSCATLNVGAIAGGAKANVIAAAAEAELGLRFADQTEERRVFEALAGLAPVRPGARLDVTRLSHRPAWPEDPTNPLAAELREIAAGLGLRLSAGTSGGAGDT